MKNMDTVEQIFSKEKRDDKDFLLSVQEYDHIPTEDACYFPALSKACLEETHKALSQRQNEEVMKHAIAFAKTYIDEFFPTSEEEGDKKRKTRNRIDMFARILEKHLKNPEDAGGYEGIIYETSVLVTQIRFALEQEIKEYILVQFDDITNIDALVSTEGFRGENIEKAMLLKMRNQTKSKIWVEDRENSSSMDVLSSFDVVLMKMLSLYRGLLFTESLLDGVRTGLVKDDSTKQYIADASSVRHKLAQELKRLEHNVKMHDVCVSFFGKDSKQ